MTGFPLRAYMYGLACSIVLSCAAILCLALAGTATAGPFEDAKAAYGRGDWATALSALRPLADKGEATAQAYLGAMYFSGEGVPQDVATAMAWLRKAADQGNAAAEDELGVIYERGMGLPADAALAARWFRTAADQGTAQGAADAQRELGRLYEVGSGVPQDDVLSAQWFAKAITGFQSGAQRGNISSEMALASMYELGEGLPRDQRQAAILYAKVAAHYRTAADRGDARAQSELAGMYMRGQGLLQDRMQAAQWYRRAADQGDALAEIGLGQLYLGVSYGGSVGWFGKSDPEDEVQAYAWLSRGVARMQEKLAATFVSTLNGIKSDMSPAQIAEADALIRSWNPVKETPPTDGRAISMTPAQTAEAARLQRELHPTPAQVDEAEKDARSYDVSLGSPTAPVTVVEYTSVGCPVCRHWEADVFPAFKTKYVDSGKARFVLREMLVGGAEEVGLAKSGFLLARCAGKDNYFAVVDAVFRIQPDIYGGKADPHAALLEIAQSVGMTEAQAETCVSDQGAAQALKARGDLFGRYEHIDSTPTFVVNGVSLKPGFRTLNELDAAIDGTPSIPVPTLTTSARPTGPHSLVFRAVDDSGPADAEARPPNQGDERVRQRDGGDIWLRPGTVITSDMFKHAEIDTDILNRPMIDMNRPIIDFQFTEEGGRRFAVFTKANVGKRVAIVWDAEVLAAPFIATPITGGSGEITGDFSAEEAAEIVRSINGSKPQTPVILHQ